MTADEYPAFEDAEFPDTLFHYTNSAGLIGIARSGMLWATDAEFMNDAQEMQFGRREMWEALLRAAEELSTAPEDERSRCWEVSHERATLMQSAASELVRRGEAKHPNAYATYVTCFCEQGDLLSQWRGYASGGGYALGFAKDKLLPALTPEEQAYSGHDHEPRPELVQVKYGWPAIAPFVESVLLDIAPQPTGHPGVKGSVRAGTIILPRLAGLKHGAFSEEREWRLVFVGSRATADVHFREGSISPTPYIQLPVAPEALRVVVIGPGNHAELRSEGVLRLLQATYGRDVPVRLSCAPFRG